MDENKDDYLGNMKSIIWACLDPGRRLTSWGVGPVTCSLLLGFDIGKAAESFVTFSIDNGAPTPLKNVPNRLPIAENLPPGEHRIRVDFAGSKMPQGAADKVRIWAVGGAGNGGPLGKTQKQGETRFTPKIGGVDQPSKVGRSAR